MNKTITLAATMLVLGTVALAISPQEANAGNGGLPIVATLTCEGKGQDPQVYAEAMVSFKYHGYYIGMPLELECESNNGPDTNTETGYIPYDAEEVKMQVYCEGYDEDTSELEKKFKYGQTSFTGQTNCNAKSGMAKLTVMEDLW